jgi:hypothetical protein
LASSASRIFCSCVSSSEARTDRDDRRRVATQWHRVVVRRYAYSPLRYVDQVSGRINSLSRKIDDLFELSGEGDDDARRQVKNKIRSIREERSSLQLERSRLEKSLICRSQVPATKDIQKVLKDVNQLLVDAAAGLLGEYVVFQAAETFRLLVGERITVVVERRSGRKRANVRGVFSPRLLKCICRMVNVDVDSDRDVDVDVWLRKPPLRDQLAELVYQLIDVQGHSYRSAAKELQRLGHNVNSGVAHQIRRRYFEMKGMPVPKLAYNNGKGRGGT